MALFVHSSCCPHDYMRMFHNDAGFLVLQIIFAGRFTRVQAGLPTLGSLGWMDQHGRVDRPAWQGGWTSVAGWMCGRCPALRSVLYGLGGAVLRGYGNLILDVLREAGGMRVERTLNQTEISVDSCMMLTAHILVHQPNPTESIHLYIPL